MLMNCIHVALTILCLVMSHSADDALIGAGFATLAGVLLSVLPYYILRGIGR